MKPVYQTICTLPGANCVQAATASILELPLQSVPNFMLTHGHPGWFQAWLDWLADRGFEVLQYRADWTPRGYYIAMGPAGAAEGDHAVVMRAGRLAHDPAGPGAAGLASIDYVYALLPLDPARFAQSPGGR